MWDQKSSKADREVAQADKTLYYISIYFTVSNDSVSLIRAFTVRQQNHWNGQQRPGRYFAHDKDYLNVRILLSHVSMGWWAPKRNIFTF